MFFSSQYKLWRLIFWDVSLAIEKRINLVQPQWSQWRWEFYAGKPHPWLRQFSFIHNIAEKVGPVTVFTAPTTAGWARKNNGLAKVTEAAGIKSWLHLNKKSLSLKKSWNRGAETLTVLTFWSWRARSCRIWARGSITTRQSHTSISYGRASPQDPPVSL